MATCNSSGDLRVCATTDESRACVIDVCRYQPSSRGAYVIEHDLPGLRLFAGAVEPHCKEVSQWRQTSLLRS